MPKGMVLAAGLGKRLRPLTKWMPKPLLPVANVPVMAQGISRLRAAGITEVCVNVSYKAPDIQNVFGDGSSLGVSLHWSVETKLLGTAGGMKNAEHFLRDDLVVIIPGDAALDVDVTRVIELHKSREATATIGTLRVSDPSQYGVVVTDADNRVLKFQEKPPPGTEISNDANTGIYVFDPRVFELIPPGAFFDFAKGVFPILLEEGLPFYACPVTGYWTDIGDPRAYLQANLDFLAGRLVIQGEGEWVGSGYVGTGARVSGVELERCVVGPDSCIAEGSHLAECVVWPGTVVSDAMNLRSAILTPYGTHQL